MPQTNLMTMRVTADNPTDAFKTLRFLLDNYSAVSDYVFQNVVLRELGSAVRAKVPVKPAAASRGDRARVHNSAAGRRRRL